MYTLHSDNPFFPICSIILYKSPNVTPLNPATLLSLLSITDKNNKVTIKQADKQGSSLKQ